MRDLIEEVVAAYDLVIIDSPPLTGTLDVAFLAVEVDFAVNSHDRAIRQVTVVDRWCRVHDMDNVFVVDASVHVTNGGFNPVLTIMALAFRAGEHIAKEWNGGGLR